MVRLLLSLLSSSSLSLDICAYIYIYYDDIYRASLYLVKRMDSVLIYNEIFDANEESRHEIFDAHKSL